LKYIENGILADAAKLCFDGMYVPLCELTEEEACRPITWHAFFHISVGYYRCRRQYGIRIVLSYYLLSIL